VGVGNGKGGLTLVMAALAAVPLVFHIAMSLSFIAGRFQLGNTFTTSAKTKGALIPNT
jgi:hypothetical protein